VEGGGGLVTTGWGVYAAGGLSGVARSDFDAAVPVNTASSYNYFGSATLTPTGGHPVVEGVSSFFVPTYTEFPNQGIDAGAVMLAAVGSTAVAAASDVGAGRSVYLGPIYAGGPGYDTAALRVGNADRLLEQAVAWVATGNDTYTFIANGGDNLVIETATPGDGPGQPENTLDPDLRLYAPDGTAVPASDYTSTSPDGRNVRIEYTAAASGFYRVVVGSEARTSGAYVLTVSGSTAGPALKLNTRMGRSTNRIRVTIENP
jgi:hypothetical protein